MSVLQRLMRRRVTLGIGIALLATTPALLYAPDWRFAETMREAAFDVTGRILPRSTTTIDVVVVDIDRASLAALGRWPWPRRTHTRLIEAIAAGRPAVVAYDMLFNAAAPEEAEDARRLAEAIGRIPTVLGMVLDPISPQNPPPAAPILLGAPMTVVGVMQEDGVAAPPDVLRQTAAGLGIISLGVAESPVVRHVPLLAAGGDRFYAGLASEAVRVARGASAYIVTGEPATMKAGDVAIPLEEGASLRLYLASESSRRRRTVSAKDVMEKRVAFPSLEGRIVVVGSSAPELGNLRATATDPFVASADIHATAIEQLLTGRIPRRPAQALSVEIAAGVGLGLAALAATLWLSPLFAGLALLGAATLWVAASFVLFTSDLLVDPVSPPLVALLVFQGAALAGFAEQRRQRSEIERRFSQHLPPEVVRRIAENPGIVRLEGEERIVTALFTDIEGFTALGERADPRDLIKILDTYVERVCAVVVEHGGIVDKIVGDAVHAFFNAPIDLPDHPRKAVMCALAIIEASEKLRQEPLAVSLQLGRTRIGIETGPAIVGDVGGGRRFDYTAHGPAVNTAAKLEAANKRFGSSIAVGPSSVALIEGIPFRPLGPVQPAASSEPILASEPWPLAKSEDVALYREAFDAVSRERSRAAALFEQLARRYPDDPVIDGWRERLGGAEAAGSLT